MTPTDFRYLVVPSQTQLVGHDFTDVGKTEQHKRDSKNGVRDTNQPTPERLWCNVAVTCNEK